MSGSINDINQMSTVAASNTNVGGISTAPGWSPANVGPAFRELMALLARMDQGLGTLNELDVTGTVTAGAAALSGALTGTSATLSGAVSAASATLSGALNAAEADFTSNVQASGFTGTSLTMTGTAQAGGVISDALDAGAAGGQFRAISTHYGVIFRNDDANLYLLFTPSGSPYGTYNNLRPFAVNLSTGALALDGTNAGTTIGGYAAVKADGGTYNISINGNAGYASSAGSASSANYANSAGSANSVAWGNISGVPAICYASAGTGTYYNISINGNANYADSAGSANSVWWGHITSIPGDIVYANGGNYDINITGNSNYSSTTTTMNTTNGNSWNSSWTGLMEISVGGTSIGAWQMQTSDYRLKEDIEPAPHGALDAVLRLRPVGFWWRGERPASGRTRGLIAHEVQEIIPSAVVVPKDAVHEDGGVRPQGIDCLVMISVLVQAVQELAAKMAVIEARA